MRKIVPASCVSFHCRPNSTLLTLPMGRYPSLTPHHRFASPNIVHPYLLLLKSYSKNTPHTNHCIVRMLHRLAVNLKMEALLFQLSVFNLFNKILSDPAAAAYMVQTRQPSACSGRLLASYGQLDGVNLSSLLHRNW